MRRSKTGILCGLLAGAALCLTAGTASAETGDPARLAKRCIDRADRIVEATRDSVAEDTADCVRRIKRLLREGRDREAQRLADACLEELSSTVSRSQQLVRNLCERCKNALLDQGEVDLAARLDRACGERITDLRLLGQRARTAILDSLGR